MPLRITLSQAARELGKEWWGGGRFVAGWKRTVIGERYVWDGGNLWRWRGCLCEDGNWGHLIDWEDCLGHSTHQPIKLSPSDYPGITIWLCDEWMTCLRHAAQNITFYCKVLLSLMQGLVSRLKTSWTPALSYTQACTVDRMAKPWSGK